MKKSRTKFLSVFVILIVAIFAVSCCFFAACKGGSDDGGNSGDTGTQQGDDTGSGSGDDSGSGSGTDGSGSDSGTDDGSESGPSQTVTKVVYLATSSDVEYTTAGEAVFENGSDLEITTSDGLTYTVSGTASTMGEAEAAWYATDDVDVGTPYVVIKIAVAEGETIYFENSEKTYTNDEEGTANFDDGYIFIVCKLSFEGDNCVTETKYDITSVEGESVTYTVSFSGIEYPKEDEPLYNEEDYIDGIHIDFGNATTYSWIPTESISYTNSKNENKSFAHGIKNGETYPEGFISLVSSIGEYSSSDPMSIGDELPNSLNTAGSTSSNNGRYFKIDLVGYETDYVTIDVSFVSNSSETARSLAISTSYDSKPTSSNSLEFITSANSETDAELSYGQEVTSSSNVLYITFDASVNIYSIDVSLYGDVKPEDVTEDPDDGQVATYTVNYAAGTNGFETESDIPSSASKQISIEFTGTWSSEISDRSKTYTYGDGTYSYSKGVKVKSFGTKEIKIVVPDSATAVTITVFTSSSGNERSVSLVGATESDVKDTYTFSSAEEHTLTASNLTGGEYHIIATNDVYIEGILITYTV